MVYLVILDGGGQMSRAEWARIRAGHLKAQQEREARKFRLVAAVEAELKDRFGIRSFFITDWHESYDEHHADGIWAEASIIGAADLVGHTGVIEAKFYLGGELEVKEFDLRQVPVYGTGS
jgi:hypothetical protein